MNAASSSSVRQDQIAEYKTLLREVIDRRPSGLRGQIALALGTHKSFVSQITNPLDSTPIPGRHVPTLLKVCQFTPAERTAFVAAYEAAHQRQSFRAAGRVNQAKAGYTTLEIRVPVLPRASQQKALESLIRTVVQRVVALIAK